MIRTGDFSPTSLASYEGHGNLKPQGVEMTKKSVQNKIVLFDPKK